MLLDGFSLQGSAEDGTICPRIALQQRQSQSAQSMDTTGQQHITWTGMAAMQVTGTQTAKGCE